MKSDESRWGLGEQEVNKQKEKRGEGRTGIYNSYTEPRFLVYQRLIEAWRECIRKRGKCQILSDTLQRVLRGGV